MRSRQWLALAVLVLGATIGAGWAWVVYRQVFTWEPNA